MHRPRVYGELEGYKICELNLYDSSSPFFLMADNYTQLNPEIDYELIHRHAPRAGFWLGMLPTHLEIEALCMDPVLGNGIAPTYGPQIHGVEHDIFGPVQAPVAPVSVQPVVNPTGKSHISYCLNLFYNNLLPVNATKIMLSVPLNTNVVGGIVSQKPLRLPVDLSFKDFFSCVCTHMELDPLNANIGYKFLGDRKTDPAFCLATEQDL